MVEEGKGEGEEEPVGVKWESFIAFAMTGGRWSASTQSIQYKATPKAQYIRSMRHSRLSGDKETEAHQIATPGVVFNHIHRTAHWYWVFPGAGKLLGEQKCGENWKKTGNVEAQDAGHITSRDGG